MTNKKCKVCGCSLKEIGVVKLNLKGSRAATPIITYRRGLPFAMMILFSVIGVHYFPNDVYKQFSVALIGMMILITSVSSSKKLFFCKECNKKYIGDSLVLFDEKDDYWRLC